MSLQMHLQLEAMVLAAAAEAWFDPVFVILAAPNPGKWKVALINRDVDVSQLYWDMLPAQPAQIWEVRGGRAGLRACR